MTTRLAPLLLALLTGCAATPGGGFLNTNTAADAGPAPTDARGAVQRHLNASLKDPYSVMDLLISTPTLTSCAVGVYGPFHGWRVDVAYNAKNSYGAYVGQKAYYYWFHGDRLVGIGQNAGYCPEAPNWR